MLYSLYTMVSVPEAKMENVLVSPILLGVFDSRETAQKVWKARPAEFKDIKAKTVHTYVETFVWEQEELPPEIYLWANYTVYGFAPDEKPEFVFTPYSAGYFETYYAYLKRKAELKALNPIPWKTVCRNSDFVFYASNEDIAEKVEINRLVRIPVELTEKSEAV